MNNDKARRINWVLIKAFFDIINANNIENSLEELKKIKEYYAKNPKDPENSEIDYYI